MVIAGGISALSQGPVAALFLTGTATVPLLIALMLVNGICLACHSRPATGFIPPVVPQDKLQAANALLGAARNGAAMLGAALAGILIAASGARIALALDAASFAFAAFLLAGLSVRAQTKTEPASMLEDLPLGAREFFSHTWLWSIVLQFTILVMGLEALFALIGPAISRDVLGGARSWGFFMSAFAAGTIAGGILAMRIHVERPMLVATFMCFFWSPLAMLMTVPFHLHVLAAAAFTQGIAGQIFNVLWSTTLQTHIPSHMLSRVSAYDHLGSVAMAPVGVVLAGMFYEDIGPQATLWIITASVIVPTASVCFSAHA